MLHSSDGQQYESDISAALGIPLEQPEKPADASNASADSVHKSSGGTSTPLRVNLYEPERHIDNSKDVPLAASALHKNGDFYGIAVDKDAPITDLGVKGWSPWHGVYEHERAEFEHMKNLKAAGMSDQDAYHEAHDRIATPIETAYVRAIGAQNGKDPDKFLDDYKQYWRDVAGKSAEPPFDRHPDAHTTTFNLDHTELPEDVRHHLQEKVQEQRDTAQGLIKNLVQPFESLGKILTGQGESEDIPQAASNFMPIGKLGTLGAAGKAIFAGVGARKAVAFKRILEDGWWTGAEGKIRFEIPDQPAKLTFKKADQSLKQDPAFSGIPGTKYNHLEDILDHPELYDAYPWLKRIKVFQRKGEEDTASTTPSEGVIIMHPASNEAAYKSTLMHEIQHNIQYKEGFTQGASYQEIRNLLSKAAQKAGIDLSQYSKKEFNDAAFEFYQKVAGENESFNVGYRSDMTPEELKANPPWRTQKYPDTTLFGSPMMEKSSAEARGRPFLPGIQNRPEGAPTGGGWKGNPNSLNKDWLARRIEVDKEQLTKLVLSGKSMQAIADEMKVSKDVIRGRMEEYGLKSRRKFGAGRTENPDIKHSLITWTPQLDKLLLDSIDQNKPIAHLAEELGIGYRTINARLAHLFDKMDEEEAFKLK